MSAMKPIDMPVFLYDGECSFCTGASDWLAAHLERRTRMLPWQEADLEALDLSREAARRSVWWIEPDGERVHSERAIARALVSCGRPWRGLGRLLGQPGIVQLAALGYRVVARNRNRLPGPTPACQRDGARVGSPSRGPG